MAGWLPQKSVQSSRTTRRAALQRQRYQPPGGKQYMLLNSTVVLTVMEYTAAPRNDESNVIVAAGSVQIRVPLATRPCASVAVGVRTTKRPTLARSVATCRRCRRRRPGPGRSVVE